nr:HAD hydrolase-like protein [uncultured Oscillibacter sp.]
MKNVIIFTDCGDTLVDESKQVFIDRQRCLVQSAELIDGAREELVDLKEHGFRVAMVADGMVESFNNIVEQHGLEPYFETRVISEAIHSQKPDAKMFRTTMERMGLTEGDLPRIVMIGNNLERDIAGANRMGICSVLLTFSPRYNMTPKNIDEKPDYTVSMPCEILPLMERLEKRYQETGKLK